MTSHPALFGFLVLYFAVVSLMATELGIAGGVTVEPPPPPSDIQVDDDPEPFTILGVRIPGTAGIRNVIGSIGSFFATIAGPLGIFFDILTFNLAVPSWMNLIFLLAPAVILWALFAQFVIAIIRSLPFT